MYPIPAACPTPVEPRVLNFRAMHKPHTQKPQYAQFPPHPITGRPPQHVTNNYFNNYVMMMFICLSFYCWQGSGYAHLLMTVFNFCISMTAPVQLFTMSKDVK